MPPTDDEEVSERNRIKELFVQDVIKEHDFRASRNQLPVPDSVTSVPSVPVNSGKLKAASFHPHTAVISLKSDADWEEFSQRILFGMARGANKRPWQRIVSILRRLKAIVCVVEYDYICLDYRSEVASFYSQLNAEISRRSTRLHFFSKEVLLKQVFILDDAQRKSYLGYVVLRPGDLPLVGRAMIAKPDYMEIAASVEETVNFFGQHIRVEGVPFMQQDERFDVCAHVAAWSAHYSAYRRGLVERRLIANFVASPQGLDPMAPVASKGLSSDDIADLFPRVGLRSVSWVGPGDDPNPRICVLDPEIQAACQTIAEAHGLVLPQENNRFGTFVAQFQGSASANVDINKSDEELGVDFRQVDADEQILCDWLIYSITHVYLESRWPIYCSTTDHALLLCGTSIVDGQPIFFFHDDQYGPYLASPSASGANIKVFDYQAWGIDAQGDPLNAPDVLSDRADDICHGKAKFSGSSDRSVKEMIIPLPLRCLLEPSEACAVVRDTLAPLGVVEQQLRVSILMGTDYRQLRRNDVKKNGCGKDALELYSSMTLAEWVILVEGFIRDPDLGEDVVKWEFVFDGSSGQAAPVVQFARLGSSGMYTPGISTPAQVFNLPDLVIRKFPRVPSKIGKAQDGDEVI